MAEASQSNTVTLIDPEGEQVQGPASSTQEALDNGYKLATPENLKEAENQHKYGEGLGNELKAGALGLGEGATFGASTWLGTKLGLLDPEATKEIEQRNPVSHGIGAVGGVLASSALLPGGGLVGGASKLGNAVSRGAEKLGGEALGSLAEGSTAASKVLNYANQVGSKAIGSAVEGALYGGVGNTITESALGDPNLNAEKLLSNFGYGALIGGALGGSAKALELGVPPSYAEAKRVLGNVYDTVVGKEGSTPGPLTKAYAKVASAVSGKSSDSILEGFQKRAPTEELNTGNSSSLTHIAEAAAAMHMPGLVPVIEAGKALANPGETISRLIKLEGVVNKVTNSIETSAKNIFSVANPALDATKGLLSQNLSPSKMLEDHLEFSDNLNKQLANPQALIDSTTAKTGEIHQAAPNITNALNSSAYTAASFLQSKLPTTVKGGILNKESDPSSAEIAHFQRYRTMVENPLSVFQQVKAGTLTPEGVEALNTVYPSLASNIKERVMDNLTALKDPTKIPYQTKLSLSMLIGEPLDQSLKPQSIASNQQVISANNLANAQQKQPSKQSNSKGLSKLTLSERSKTNFQQAATR